MENRERIRRACRRTLQPSNVTFINVTQHTIVSLSSHVFRNYRVDSTRGNRFPCADSDEKSTIMQHPELSRFYRSVSTLRAIAAREREPIRSRWTELRGSFVQQSANISMTHAPRMCPVRSSVLRLRFAKRSDEAPARPILRERVRFIIAQFQIIEPMRCKVHLPSRSARTASVDDDGD